jgi:hypothetical protein
MMRRSLSCSALLLALAACDNAGESLATPTLETGGIAVGIYLDRDATGSFTVGDTAFAGARVALLAASGIDTVATAVSDNDGTARFLDVPLGSWRVVLDRAGLGDSIATAVGDTGVIRLTAQRDSIVGSRVVRLAFREVSVAEARALPSGRRVVVRGVVGSALQFFTDASTHLTGSGSWLRIIPSRHRPGRTGNNIGDSVSVLATTASRDGQPTLADGLILTLAERPAPAITPVSVAEIRTARGGALDAALVEVVDGVIADTVAVGDEFLVRIAAGNDTARVRLDARLQTTRSAFAPGRLLSARGVLVPRDGQWELKPRPVNGELTLRNPPTPPPPTP